MIRAATLVLLGLTGVATASPARLEIRGNACDLSSLPSSITTELGADALDANSSVVMTVESFPAQSGAQAHVWFDDGKARHGPRLVIAASCSELVDAVAVIAAMALPELVSPEPHPALQTVTVVPSQPDLAVTARANRRPASRPRTSIEGFAAAAGGLSRHGIQQQLIVGVRRRQQGRSIGIEARLDVPDQIAVAGGAVSVWTSTASLSGCVHVGSVAGCALASAGFIRGAGERLEVTSAAFSLRAAMGGRLTWEHAVSPSVAIRLHVDAEANLTRTRFDVDHMPVWVSDRFALWTGAGVIAHFP